MKKLGYVVLLAAIVGTSCSTSSDTRNVRPTAAPDELFRVVITRNPGDQHDALRKDTHNMVHRHVSRRWGLLTVTEASTLLSLTKSTVYQLTSQRRILHFKIGCRVLSSEEKLWEWLDKHAIAS